MINNDVYIYIRVYYDYLVSIIVLKVCFLSIASKSDPEEIKVRSINVGGVV